MVGLISTLCEMNLGESESTKVCCMFVFMVHKQVILMRQSKTAKAVFTKYIRINAGVLKHKSSAFLPKHKDALHSCLSVIFCHCNHVTLDEIQAS